MAGIYIHIPFCKQACNYCDFHFSTNTARKEEMISALLREAELRKTYLGSEEVQSIYLGGGTPSLLSADEVSQILEGMFDLFAVNPAAEISLEANPDDLDKNYLRALKSTAVNRLSIGVQSFQAVDLRFMNRAHSAEEARSSLQLAQDAGFGNLTIDLIFGSPTTSDSMWEENLRIFFELGIPHLSAYSLTVEEKTLLAHQIQAGQVEALDAEKNFRQYSFLQQQIGLNDFEQYELSNYCEAGKVSKHNTSYWKSSPYLGLGPSAHSYNGRSRQWNISNNAQYLRSMENGKSFYEKEELSAEDRYHEYLITSLRTKWGVDKKTIKEQFPDFETHFYNQLKKLDVNLFSEDESKVVVEREHWFQSDFIVRALMLP